MTTTTSNYQIVLEQVAHWPPPERLALVQDIIGTLAHELRADAPRAATWPAALGLLTTDQPAPTDADVKRWLAEQREEKYQYRRDSQRCLTCAPFSTPMWSSREQESGAEGGEEGEQEAGKREEGGGWGEQMGWV